MRKRKILRFFGIALLVVLGVLVFLSITGTVAHAAGLVDNTVSDANAYSKYPLENYQLDFYVDSSWDWLPWNWLDGIGKSIQYGLYAITNFVWTVSLYISNATGYVVQEAYQLDFISDTASSIGKNIQTLAGVTQSGFSSEGFYVGFLLILILVMGIYVAYTGLIKRETTKAVHAVVNFLVVFILSASFIAYAPNYISKINDFSADISSSALSLGTKIVLPDSSSKGKDSVDLIRDSLFSIQVKQPWLLLQYGESDIEKLGSDRVKSLLEASPDTDDREDIVVEEIEDKDNANLSVMKGMANRKKKPARMGAKQDTNNIMSRRIAAAIWKKLNLIAFIALHLPCYPTFSRHKILKAQIELPSLPPRPKNLLRTKNALKPYPYKH